MNLSFCGCGFLGIYHLGAAKALTSHGPKLLKSIDRVAGASAGALIATALVCNPYNLNACKDFFVDLCQQARSPRFGPFSPSFNALDPVKRFMKSYLPTDSHVAASGVVHISVTSFHRGRPKHEVISDFKSNDELLEALLISCFIPGYTGLKVPRKNNMEFSLGRGLQNSGKKSDPSKTWLVWETHFPFMRYLDGGFTNNLYIFDEGRTITISPFSGDMDIAPSDLTKFNKGVTISNMKVNVNFQNVHRCMDGVWPSPGTDMLAYYERGFIDCVNFLKQENCFEGTGRRIALDD